MNGGDKIPTTLNPLVLAGTREALEILINNYKTLETWTRKERQRLEGELRNLVYLECLDDVEEVKQG